MQITSFKRPQDLGVKEVLLRVFFPPWIVTTFHHQLEFFRHFQLELAWGVRGICSWGNPVGHCSITSQEAGLYHYRATRRLTAGRLLLLLLLVGVLVGFQVELVMLLVIPLDAVCLCWVCWVWKIQCFWSWLLTRRFLEIWSSNFTVEVLERLLEHCPREQTEPIAREASSSFWSFKTWLF